MCEKINDTARYCLTELMKEHDPDLGEPVDVYWEISEETANEF